MNSNILTFICTMGFLAQATAHASRFQDFLVVDESNQCFRELSVTSTGCDHIKIDCTSLPPGVGASCQRSECQISLPKRDCDALGVKEGQVFTPGLIFKTIDSAKADNYNEAWANCTLFHETTHSTHPTSMKRCQSEVEAYQAGGKCMQKFYEQNCLSNPTRWDSEECSDFSKDISNNKKSAQYNQCVCGLSAGTPLDCSSCDTECKADGVSDVFCDNMHKLYCRSANVVEQ